MRNLLLLIALLLYGTTALADTGKPAEINSLIHASKPYGKGTYSALLIKAYDATLWTDASTWSVQSPFALTLRYRLHFTSKEIADRSISEMQRIEPLSKSDAADFDAQLAKLFPEVKSGDTITALYTPQKGAEIFYNGKSTGHIANDAMARRFLDIWLSSKTSAPDLRKQLLSGSN